MRELVWCLLIFILISPRENQTRKIIHRRQIWREQLDPAIGGKVPDFAFHPDRLHYNRLDFQRLTVPDGKLTESRPYGIAVKETDPEDVAALLPFLDAETAEHHQPHLSTTYLVRHPYFKAVITPRPSPSTSRPQRLPPTSPSPPVTPKLVTSRPLLFANRSAKNNTVPSGDGGLKSKSRNEFGGENWDALVASHTSRYNFRKKPVRSQAKVFRVTSNFRRNGHIPHTSFNCEDRPPGYYADTETDCQVFHMCQTDGRHDAFSCPKGTRFHDKLHVCVWERHVHC